VGDIEVARCVSCGRISESSMKHLFLSCFMALCLFFSSHLYSAEFFKKICCCCYCCHDDDDLSEFGDGINDFVNALKQGDQTEVDEQMDEFVQKLKENAQQANTELHQFLKKSKLNLKKFFAKFKIQKRKK
jgi:hypothetical protein